MTLQELHDRTGALLAQGVPPQAEALLAIDPEGNGFRPLIEVRYNTFSWDGPRQASDVQIAVGPSNANCVVLWPE